MAPFFEAQADIKRVLIRISTLAQFRLQRTLLPNILEGKVGQEG